MDFCPHCNNIFDITKTASSVGGYNEDTNDEFVGGAKVLDYDEIINKIINNEQISKSETEGISLDDLIKSNSYKKLKFKQKEFVFNKIQDLIPIQEKKIIKEQQYKQPTEKAFFICKNCGFLKQIEEGTLIFSKVSSDLAQSYTTSDFIDMANSDILPKTRKYICPNDKCPSQSDFSKREAAFFRLNNSYKIKYICLTCKTTF